MQLCSVEQILNTSWTLIQQFFDRFSCNQNIGEGESYFDKKNVEEVFNFCSTCVQQNRVAYILELLVTKLVL